MGNFTYEFNLIIKILCKKIFYEILIFLKIIPLDKDKKYFLKRAISFKNISGAAHTIRLCDQIDEYLSKFKPRYFVLTIEGNSWEKILIRHIKNKYKNVFIIGVQFSTIYSFDYPLKKKIGKIFEPDFLICKN